MLLVTGLLAEKSVHHYARESRVETEVLVLKTPVAAFLTPEQIASAVENLKCRNFDFILIPGLTRGDASIVAEITGIPTFKGPRYAADLAVVLEALGKVELSTVTPACEILAEELQRKALLELEVVEKAKNVLLKKPGNMLIKGLAIGRDFPMRVMAEIVDAPLIPADQVKTLAKKYVAAGADIVDVGMVAGESIPLEAKRLVEAVKSVVDVPVSIDTLNPDEIIAAVSAGADIVLSLDAGNLEKIAPYVSKVAVVAIPTNQREGRSPKKAEERVNFLEEIITRAKKLGVAKIIGDLVLDPLNVLESFAAYRDFENRNPDVPLFVGISNVTELIDADSVGVNALLARLSSEVGAGILLATEKSPKARGSIVEEVLASKMMFLAKKRNSVPKDLGIDLFILKDKRMKEEPYDRELELETPVTNTVEKPEQAPLDGEGVFKIVLDRDEGKIAAIHFATAMIDKPDRIIKGENAEAVYETILDLGLVRRLDHAAYLGSELAKAEIALKTGKNYVQDAQLFRKGC